jgi:hypothetical protein
MSNLLKQWLYYILGIFLVALGAMIAGIYSFGDLPFLA